MISQNCVELTMRRAMLTFLKVVTSWSTNDLANERVREVISKTVRSKLNTNVVQLTTLYTKRVVPACLTHTSFKKQNTSTLQKSNC